LTEIIDDDLDSLKPVEPETKKSGLVEKYGVDRIVENLECHLWANMV
jgi:hypothetical protein